MKLDLDLLQRFLQYGIVILDWARDATWKRLLVWLVVAGGIAGATVVGVQWLLSLQRDEGNRWRSELILRSRESNLQLASDSIGNCIKSLGESLSDRRWYCDRAIFEYRRVSEHWPQERVNEVIQKRAFLAMHSEVAHYIRSVEMDRRMLARTWEERENQVRFALSPQGFAIWIAIAVLVLGFAASRLWLPQRHKAMIRKVKKPRHKPV